MDEAKLSCASVFDMIVLGLQTQLNLCLSRTPSAYVHRYGMKSTVRCLNSQLLC